MKTKKDKTKYELKSGNSKHDCSVFNFTNKAKAISYAKRKMLTCDFVVLKDYTKAVTFDGGVHVPIILEKNNN